MAPGPPTLSDKDLHWEYYRASGPGGQHRNKVATAVRLTHLPTGVTVSATERRSRVRNRDVALRRLTARLAEMTRPEKKRKPTKPSRAARLKRLEAKKRRGRVKVLRRRPVGE